MDEYYRRRNYDSPTSQKRRAEREVKTPNSVEILRAKHSDEKAELGRRHRAESQKLQNDHDNEIAHDAGHRAGHGRGDRPREKERHDLASRHHRERDALDSRHHREMTAAKEKAAQDLK
jgi:hypothetical protein